MLTRSRRRRERLSPNADINLINLVDLAFVLLIIFIVTAPMLQSGIDVVLPRTAAAPVTSNEGVVVSVDRSGRIYLGEVAMKSIDEFGRVLPSYLRQHSKREVYLRGDEGVRYGTVLQVFGRMKQLNIAEVHLMVDPEVLR
ncbi:MAG: ExbD/TolR family protein [Longimicrobiales bacterium]